MTICKETTFKELKKLVGSTKGLAKLPTAKELRNSDEEIVFDGDVAGAHFIIYKSGLFIYSRSVYATVYAVDRCTEIEYPCVYADEGGLNVTAGCKHRVKTDRDGQKHLIMIVPETEYMNGPWAMPLDVVGTHRLDHNSDSREQSHSDFSLSNDGTDWENKAVTPDFTDIQEAEEREEELCRKLEEVKKKLTDKQREVIQHAFYEDPLELCKCVGAEEHQRRHGEILRVPADSERGWPDLFKKFFTVFSVQRDAVFCTPLFTCFSTGLALLDTVRPEFCFFFFIHGV